MTYRNSLILKEGEILPYRQLLSYQYFASNPFILNTLKIVSFRFNTLEK